MSMLTLQKSILQGCTTTRPTLPTNLQGSVDNGDKQLISAPAKVTTAVMVQNGLTLAL
jgi:hypothetical protein